MKYSIERVNLIIEAIKGGHGRVKAVNSGGISYETFNVWMKEKPEFSELVKKAENEGLQLLRETCLDAIIQAATNNHKPIWQAAAWILERKFPAEFRQRYGVDTENRKELSTKDIIAKAFPEPEYNCE
jgi:hypothetical protein